MLTDGWRIGSTVWKVSVFKVSPVCIFLDSDWIRRDTQSECRKIQTRKTPNTDIFHAVLSWGVNMGFDKKVLYFHYISIMFVWEKNVLPLVEKLDLDGTKVFSEKHPTKNVPRNSCIRNVWRSPTKISARNFCKVKCCS